MKFDYQHQHNAEALLITCIDFRFHQATTEYVRANLANDFDLLTIPGVAKNFAENNVLSQESIKIIKNVSLPLHHIKKIILMGHWDCGGYGGSKNFDSETEEENKYRQDLVTAKDLLTKEFSDLEILIGYSKVTGDQIEFKTI